MKDKITNIIISGIGGQGVLTLAYAIAESAMRQGYDVTTAEVHGLSMRFGHLEVHVRIGKKVLSPLVPDGEADLVVGMEPIETMRAARYMSKNTSIIFDTARSIPNKMHIHKEQYPETKEIISVLKKISKSVKALPASEIVKKRTGSNIQANIYTLGYLVKSKLIPINQKNILDTLDLLPSSEINKTIFKLGVQQA